MRNFSLEHVLESMTYCYCYLALELEPVLKDATASCMHVHTGTPTHTLWHTFRNTDTDACMRMH